MINDITYGSRSTSTDTRIDTFLVVTSFSQGTLEAYYTFGPTCGWIASIARYTWTNCLSVWLSTLTIRSTWWRVTWILDSNWNWNCRFIYTTLHNFIYCAAFDRDLLPAEGRHSMKALPLIPLEHVHIGMWFVTIQLAFNPHVPIHGSTHLFFWQPLSAGQSEL